jgi:hypothetical protein
MSKVDIVAILISFLFLSLLPRQVFALERDQVLDQRLGVTHVGGNYPDRRVQQDFLTWGGTKAYKLGFSSIEIWMPSNMCFSQLSYGVYQARDKYCEPTPGKWPKAKSLTEFVKHPDFAEMFSQLLTLLCPPLNPGFRNPGRAETAKLISGVPYTPNELALLKEEYYNFTKYLLETYRNTKKSFAVMPVVTMDRWLSGRDFEDDDNPGVCNASDSAPQARIDNMITYFQTISSASARLNRRSRHQGHCTLKEVNSVICPMEGGAKLAINSVIPNAGVTSSVMPVRTAQSRIHATIRADHQNPNYMASQTPIIQILG